MNSTYSINGFTINGVERWSYSNGTSPPLCGTGCVQALGGIDCDCNEWFNVLP